MLAVGLCWDFAHERARSGLACERACKRACERARARAREPARARARERACNGLAMGLRASGLQWARIVPVSVPAIVLAMGLQWACVHLASNGLACDWPVIVLASMPANVLMSVPVSLPVSMPVNVNMPPSVL
eukprot:8183338-Alexandrium_andersonii.AAC.1